ncbi:Protein-glutamate methylesterase/protein-glutamine glutaminase [Flavobacterium bizetiae]|uniref:Protein-glutamate methylesterase/protein-glutamine glutaminase n=1 Tax=Flavobacterium bizetiae TaxID=2704140 RepID=A0A6J4GMS9_9FLAO|nr:CheR family methyltransferase [Flavobacterium bizetiae]CAA9200445.1 Protein-glutamate methylesterase/protein-glutamine glutaminase [Flavobacterium bizetiae]CAD5340605.1 Protein-glutamate methylesterase/protein-glutamine glutaminase [Flavobacterium bizetiae]CAD5346723.1 Protein-glutamate methylesterase/protein-glutamine glutaminase [Flavobacterium bizetiae]
MHKQKSSLPKATRQDFPIVGIGASAGGLEAFRQFIEAVPSNSEMAYVIVQHLHPLHDSMLTELLSRVAKIPINEITDDIHLAPNNIYVIPENKMLTSYDGVLKLSPRQKDTKNQAIDVFFNSLAEVHLDLAYGVLLSGNGSDGTIGLKAIKKHGGITFAQDIEAANSEMPQNAINAGVVDYVLSPSQIVAKLIELAKAKENFIQENDPNDEVVFQEIIKILRHHSGVDFTYYKQTTIRRRIARRMALNKIVTLRDYLKVLQGDKVASEDLFNDLLIPVTEFFRDTKIFQIMREKVFPILTSRVTEGNSIRIWIAGCSTGEEAYTLAIALHEYLGENLEGKEIQIFASDISEVAIAKARIGFYRKSQMRNVSETILTKYFTANTSGYKIKRQIRDLCIFAVHNFLTDPPFARMDLITCRNVFIYMDSFLQKKSLTTFHYALKENGFLLLGKSETAVPAAELFQPFEKAGKIYTRKQVSGRFVHSGMESNDKLKTLKTNIPRKEIIKEDFRKSAEAVLLSNYTPASVIVNEQMDIVHINGSIADFIELSTGKPTFNLLKMAREGLAFELRNIWHKAKESGALVKKEGIQVKSRGAISEITIEIRLLEDTSEPYFLVLFYKSILRKEDISSSEFTADEIRENANLRKIAQLEKELAKIHDDVNAISEEQEASNEELQSANEELLSGSEELQSLNEELETSKEELQSSNEELLQINQELLNKQQQINISKNYTEAIVATLREPIVVLDTNLRIKNINRAFSKKYNIAKEEASGKLIYEIQNHLFDNIPMRAMLEKVLPEKTQLDDYQISVNLLPYGESIMLLNARQVTNENSKEQLILLAIEDITERRIIEKRLQILSSELEAKVEERTTDLLTANKELESSVKNLHGANVQLQEYAYVASHDLQEPLRKILMFISRLLEMNEDFSAEALVLVEKISKSSIRMNTLIKDLLAYSYLNNPDRQFVTTDLNVILADILVDFELMIEERKLDIKVGLLPVINAIPLQMNQLFYNLISNALKFYKNDGSLSKVEIYSQKVSAGQVQKYPTLDPKLSYCEIIIKDNGIGFNKQYENKIFTIFQRLHNNEVYSGTGIGLAIGKKIVENHKGIIFSKAEEDVGAEFHIILPV